jgi:hypothetical protein
MIVRALDSNGDWIFGVGKNAYLAEKNAVAQAVRCRLYSFFGDCFFDLEAGLDWFNLLGGKDMTALQVAISSTILGTEGVTGIYQLSLSLNRSTRALSIAYQAQTVYSVMGSSFEFTLSVQP